MADMPKYEKTVVERHEWTIGDPYHTERKITARELSDGIRNAHMLMQAQEVDLSYDDAYYARGNEDGTITLYYETEIEK